MTDAARENGLAGRVERLEAEVRSQGARIREMSKLLNEGGASARSTGSSPVEASPVEGEFEERARRFREKFGGLLRAEWWFTRGGVFLLLLGVAFLFKLSVDEGWITPPVRVAFGLVLGAALIFWGLRVYVGRAAIGQVFLGGGVAALYASGFAAFTLYSLIPAFVAFPFMLAVTVAAFALAIRQDAATLSVIGVSGGLATPFLLYTDEGSLISLTLYTSLVFAGAVGVYLYRGWRTLIGVASTGALLVFSVATANFWPPDAMPGERAALLSGITFCWFVSWAAPMLRSYALRVNRPVEARVGVYLAASLALPVASVMLFRWAAELEYPVSGYLTLGLAAFYGAIWSLLWRADGFRDGRVVYAQAAAGILLANLAAIELLDSWTPVLFFAVEAATLHFLASANRDTFARIAGHAVFSVLALWFSLDVVDRLDSSFPGRDSISWLVWLGALTLAFLASFRLSGRGIFVYRIAVHAGLLGWMLAVISPLPNGEVWTTVAWGLYGAVLVVSSLRRDLTLPFRAGLATLLLVVGKLFLVDLFWVEPIFRIALFIGFGGLFLFLGYGLQLLWRPTRTPQ